jgi:hypothetical protein
MTCCTCEMDTNVGTVRLAEGFIHTMLSFGRKRGRMS